MSVELKRVENRCRCGFLVGSGLCPTHEKGIAIEDGGNFNEKLVSGVVVGTSTIVRKIDGDTIEMRCKCDATFNVPRSTLWKARHRGTRVTCAKCRKEKPWKK